jgi:hypothetical protein
MSRQSTLSIFVSMEEHRFKLALLFALNQFVLGMVGTQLIQGVGFATSRRSVRVCGSSFQSRLACTLAIESNESDGSVRAALFLTHHDTFDHVRYEYDVLCSLCAVPSSGITLQFAFLSRVHATIMKNAPPNQNLTTAIPCLKDDR